MKKMLLALSLLAACGLQAADNVIIKNTDGAKGYEIKACDADSPNSCSIRKAVSTNKDTLIKVQDVKMRADAKDKEAAGGCAKRIRLYRLVLYRDGETLGTLQSVMPGSTVELKDKEVVYTKMNAVLVTHKWANRQ